MKKIILANDHAAIEFRPRVISFLEKKGYSLTDLGVGEERRVDYPDMAQAACELYLKSPDEYDFGLLICGTGIGISIAANRFQKIRCALIHDTMTATLAKEHNNANFIALGARTHYSEKIEDIIEAFIVAKFQEGRHLDRINKFESLQSTS